MLASHARLEEVEQQLRWFKQQLFGRRSERRILEPDLSQLCLGESLAAKAEDPIPTTTVRSHARRKRPEREASDDEVLATAILDRLLHHSHVLNISGRSYRLRELEQAARSSKPS